jgi:3-deoxy-manno-octulosonate cytidylyltransferase (CMP-KDO synthetase)
MARAKNQSQRPPQTLPVNPIIVIPARMASTRLPGKPLADIHGEPMIVHVWRRAVEAELGPVVVAAGEAEIVQAVERVGGQAILTRPDHPSGSDRIAEALERIDPEERHDAIINLQGDLPTLEPEAIRAVLWLLAEEGVDIGTLAAIIERDEERDDPNVVKAVAVIAEGARTGRALYFSRARVPAGDGPHLHHIGIYAYRRGALARFVAAPEGVVERRERLEQLRAFENGMRIDVALVDTLPLGVDTPADLERACRMLAPR